MHANSLNEVPARMEALAALGGLDRTGLHSQLAAAVDVVLTMSREPEGRRLREIGILTGNPVTTEVIWSAESGEHPGYQEFTNRIMPRTDFTEASESSAPSEAPASKSVDIDGLHIPAGFEGSFNNFPLGEGS